MSLRQYIIQKKHHAFRKEHEELQNLAQEYARLGLSPVERMTRRFERLAALETPVLLPEEKICFLRTVKVIPDCFTPQEWAQIKKTHFIHELGYMSNLCPDYERVIAKGLLACREEADPWGKRVITAILSLADRYRQEALAQGRTELAQVLERVPRYGATGFYEALQFFRILHFSLWLEGNYHNTVGRFDQYMYTYLRSDLEKGIHTEETALALLEDFFLSFNKDSDLYPGVQQGDNGQSMVLGGLDPEGKQAFNLLSELCLKASEKLLLIDPKINLRVGRDTPLSVYELGSRLTKAGLGFPQYSNDDVVIEGLQKLGYAPEDARNYAVAACWEFIIPAVGADVANIGALSFPKVIDICLHEDLAACKSFEAFLEKVRQRIGEECDRLCSGIRNLWFVPSPFMEVMMGRPKYHNFGIHGTGVATAADSLAAIGKYIYEEKTIAPEQLLEAVDSDFQRGSELLPLLRYEAPKTGNNDPLPDGLLAQLLQMFAGALKGRKNCMGGNYRAGTGSAMFYLWHAGELGASADGRRKGEAFGTNFSPSLFAKTGGPFSVVQSYTKPDFTEVINGGPLTLEFSAAMFRQEDSLKKLAALVKAYIDMGGHQLQLNTVDTETLKAARKNPDAYRQLVVRVWGWSAYFVELDEAYQNHVLQRQQYCL